MKLFTKEVDKQLFAQYPKGSDLENQMVVAKIFNPYGRGVWYLLNSDPEDPDYIWAIVDLFEPEMGSVSRSELQTVKVPPFGLGLERDIYFTPKPAKEVFEGVLRGERYEKGGSIASQNKDMLENQTANIMHHAGELHEAVKNTNIEIMPWVLTKIQRAATDLQDVSHYLEGEEAKYGAGGMTVGRYYKDNSGQELRFIGESQGKLLFNDGEKIITKSEEDFEDSPKEYKLFGFFADGGRVVGRNNQTGESYGVVIGSVKKADEFDGGGIQMNVRSSYDSRISESTLYFDNNGNLLSITDYGSAYDGKYPSLGVGSGRDYNADKKETLKVLSDKYTPAFAKRLIELSKGNKMEDGGEIEDEYAKGGQIQEYIVWVSKDGEKRELHGQYKSQRAADMQLKKLWEKGEYKSIGNKPKSMYEKEGLYAHGGETAAAEHNIKQAKYGAKLAKGGGIYSSDSLYYLQVLKDGEEVGREKYRAKSLKEAREIGEDEYEDKYKKKFGDHLSFIVSEAMAEGGEIEKIYGERIITDKNGNQYAIKNWAAQGYIIPFDGSEYWEHFRVPKENWIKIEDINWSKFNISKSDFYNYLDSLNQKASEILNKYRSSFAMGGKVKFEDKVKAVQKSLLKRKKVAPVVQKDYGKTYNKKEALESAKRIIGAQTAKWEKRNKK
jgi:hypothetical protein